MSFDNFLEGFFLWGPAVNGALQGAMHIGSGGAARGDDWETSADRQRRIYENRARVAQIRQKQKEEDKNEEDNDWCKKDYDQCQYLTPKEQKEEFKELFDEAINIVKQVKNQIQENRQNGSRAVSEEPAEEEKDRLESAASLSPEEQREQALLAIAAVSDSLMEAYRDNILRQFADGEICAQEAFDCARATRWYVKSMQKHEDYDKRKSLTRQYEYAIDPTYHGPWDKALEQGMLFAVVCAFFLVVAPQLLLQPQISLPVASKIILASGCTGALFGGLSPRKNDPTAITKHVDEVTKPSTGSPRPSGNTR